MYGHAQRRIPIHLDVLVQMGGGGDIRPPKISNIRYQTPQKNKKSDIWLKNKISDIRPPKKNQLSDITNPKKIKYQISRYPGPYPPLAPRGVIYATGSLGTCLWNPKIRPTQVPAHTQIKDPYKYQESRCQCFVCCLCTHIGIHLDITVI